MDCGDCERVCSGGNASPIASQPTNGDNTIPERNGVNNMSDSTTLDGGKKSQGMTNIRFVRSDSTDSKPEENGKDKEDNVSIKSRSMSLTSMCSLSYTFTNDGKSSFKKTLSLGFLLMSFIFAEEIPTWLRTPELLALQHNLTFPESATASPVAVRRAHKCRRFCVDLSQMRSLRLFFADPECTSGQLVVASRESQYKILHFHHGGLDRLAATLHQWHKLLNPSVSEDTEDCAPYRLVTYRCLI